VPHIGEKSIQVFEGKNLKERDYLEDLSIDEITKN
jgi:hypothetical protein